MADILSTASPFSAYVALDEDDRDPVRFLAFLAEALEGVSACLGAGACASLARAPGARAGLASEMEEAFEQELWEYQCGRFRQSAACR